MRNWFFFKLFKFWRLALKYKWVSSKENVLDKLQAFESGQFLEESEEIMPLNGEELDLVEDFANILVRMKGYKPVHLSFGNDEAPQTIDRDEVYFDILVLDHEENNELLIKEDLMLMRNWLSIESSSNEQDDDDEDEVLEEINNSFNALSEENEGDYIEAERIIYAATTLSTEDLQEFRSPVALGLSIAKRVWNSNGWEFCPVRCRIVKGGQSPMLFALEENEFNRVVNDRFASFMEEIEEPQEDDDECN